MIVRIVFIISCLYVWGGCSVLMDLVIIGMLVYVLLISNEQSLVFWSVVYYLFLKLSVGNVLHQVFWATVNSL
jgi:hypothetical protein